MSTVKESRTTLDVQPPRVEADAQGNEFELRAIDCPTCGASDQQRLGERGGRSHRYGLGVQTPIARCRSCSLLFPNPFPYPRAPQTLYGDPAKYFERHGEAQKVQDYRRLTQWLVRSSGLAQPSLLDVGSGRGELLEAARLEGVRDLVGLELSQAMIAYVRDHYGIPVLPQTIEEYARSSSRTFDVIVLNAVLEHVYDPDAMIQACARLTRSGSLLYIDTPNEPHLLTVVGNAINRLRGNPAVFNLAPTWPPYHVFGFNPRALRILLHKHGFEITSLRIYAEPTIPAGRALGDRLKAFVGTQLGRLANVTGTASNMFVLARRR
jgi:SAM-dependent methyltransferase